MTIRNIKMECNINVILAACLICISGNVVAGMSIEEINDKVNITGDGDQYLATMDENNHDFDTSTQLFKIAGVDEDCSSIPVAFLESANFTYEIKTDCIFYATQSFDYESNQRNYLMTIGKSPSSVNVRLVINNIDDEDPEITSIKCSFNEYTDYTLANSTCTCIVKDPDGWLNTATFQVYPGTSAEDTIFAMDYTADFADTITEADVTMYLKTQLHYEEINMYSFTISVTDPANHVSPTQSAVVSVVDLRNTNPIWTNIKNFMQFNELEPQKYTVTATDGDTGINQKIYYYKVSEDNQDENYISIEKETGLVNVKPIDRDNYDMLLYNFILSACVSDAPDYCSEEKCQFYIIDIDNQIPNITKNIWTDSDKVVEYGDDDKIVELSYLENYEGNYNFTTTISDRDTGENAQFTVALVNVDEGGEVDFTEPYLVVPGTGYRSGNFTISVRDKTYLDFENETWKEHQYYVVSTGTLNTSHTDKLLVKVTLEDYNDEYPIFEKTEYSTEILETAKKGENVLTAHATDRDAEDKVLTMEILGTYAQSRLNINSDGEITVSIDDAFDYDTLNSIYFQVTATDKGNHTVSVPVTITLLDVNNKAPTINPVKPVEVEENQPNGSILNISITASDVDQTGNLTSRIDWNNSYVTKNNIQKDITDEVKTAMQFLEVQNEQGNGGRNLTVSLVVINNDNDKPNKPDYETFDTLYLSLIVEDQNTDKDFKNNRETSTTVTITIIDINDNPPYFPDSNVENRTVQELASQGTSVGFLKALDPDTVSTNITYSCTAVDDSQDWVEINATTGAFTVKDEGQVNADDPITWYFNYTCAASDQEFESDPLIVAFYIIDTNSETPVNDLPNEVSVTEKSPKDTLISEIPTSDKDRDIPFHTVVCSFDLSDTDNTPVCIKKFQITNNNLRVLNGGDDIDRDRGQPSFTCSISCSDNPNGDRNQPRKTVTQQVKIILEDINDNKPELITTELDCSENLKAEEMMGYIIGRDIDEGVNSDITFSITSITGTANVPQLSILIDDDYRINETYKQVQLRPDEDLKGFYGSYVLNLFMEDGGTPSQSDNGILTLTIERFNYHTPTIVYPEESTSAITLLSSQTPNSPLILFPTGNMLPNFVATDGETNDCSKWNVTFTIKQNNYENNQIFTIAYLTGCEAQLQVNDNFKTEDALRNIFELTVTAWVVQDGTPRESEAPYYTSVNIKVTFLDNGMQPFFPDTTPWVVKFPENNAQQSIALPQNATYNVSDTSELPPILYYLISDVKRHYELFEVDPDTGTLSVKDIFYYDEDKEFDFQIMASNDSNTDISNDVNSTLSVTVLVQSTNRRPPQWENPPFFGAAMPGFVSGNVILTAQASDPDAIDQGNLVCSISGEIIPSATGVDNIGDTPFYVKTENDMAQVNLNFTVENTMSGYFTFMIAVEDHDDNYGNKAHKVEASATIFIITTENTVDFGFYNNISDVQNNEIEMLEIVADVVGYNAYRQSIFSSTSTTGEDLSTARLYFIQTDGGTVTLITRETILKIVGNLNTFATLANRLRSEQGLMLTSFGSTSTGGNSEAALRAWLTGVSVVMGVVCCILLVTLILKTKQLNKRISKLTTKQFGSQESGLNRLGVTAPTTNKHAIEGSNPVYKNEDFRKPNNKMNELDTQSIRSGDSDLIGIENNPEFDYNFNNPRDDKTTYL